MSSVLERLLEAATPTGGGVARVPVLVTPGLERWLGSNDALSASIVTVRTRTAKRLNTGVAKRYTPYVLSLA